MQTAFYSNIKTIIFDLDGTLYQSNRYYADYLRFMIAGTQWESEYNTLLERIEQIFCGERLRMNTAYHLEKIDADTVDELFEKLEQTNAPEMKYEELVCNNRYVFLGDGWSVMKVVGTALGLLDGTRADITYLQTREMMLESELLFSDRLSQVLANLRTYFSVVLISNASKALADNVLKAIGCENTFDKVVCDAKKPSGFHEALKKLNCMEVLEQPESVLTVGDHALNDLCPLKRIGCKTLWVNPFSNTPEMQFDKTVRSMDELVDFLDQLNQQKDCSRKY